MAHNKGVKNGKTDKSCKRSQRGFDKLVHMLLYASTIRGMGDRYWHGGVLYLSCLPSCENPQIGGGVIVPAFIWGKKRAAHNYSKNHIQQRIRCGSHKKVRNMGGGERGGYSHTHLYCLASSRIWEVC